MVSHGIPMGALWRSAQTGKSVIVADVDPLLTPLLATIAKLHVPLKLEDPGGALAWIASGAEMNAGVEKLPRETGLPWVVRVASSDPAEEMAGTEDVDIVEVDPESGKVLRQPEPVSARFSGQLSGWYLSREGSGVSCAVSRCLNSHTAPMTSRGLRMDAMC